jgi:hypothetical protein
MKMKMQEYEKWRKEIIMVIMKMKIMCEMRNEIMKNV